MSRSLLFRLQAAGLHLLGSGMVIGAFLWLVYAYWYLPPYQIVYSTLDVVKILIAVDLVLGPLMTLIVFNVAKPRKELVRDLSLILALQLGALSWGVYVTYSVRPQFLAFVGNTVYAVNGRDINLAELPDNIPQRVWNKSPVPVSVRGPQSQEEWKQHFNDYYNNKVPELMYQPKRYRPYSERTVHSTVPSLSATELRARGEAVAAWVDRVESTEVASNMDYYTIMSGTFTSLAAVRKSDGVLTSVMPLPPVTPPKNKS